MRPTTIPFLLVLAVAACASAPAVADGDSGATPYAVLYQTLGAARALDGQAGLRAVQRIESKLPGVRPQDIDITIHAGAGAIRVPVAADGSTRFPLRDDLLAENPPVSSNQPRGSLTVSVTLALPNPASTRLPAEDLRSALRAVDAWLARQADAGGTARGVAGGVEFRFPSAAGASLTVRGDDERFLLADAAGRIVVMREAVLERATFIELSQLPLEVVPWIAPR